MQKLDRPGFGHRHTWNLTQAEPDGEVISLPGAADRTVQVFGTFNGATVAVLGSLDGENWRTLHDFMGAELSFTSAAITLMAENPEYIKLTTTGAGASTDVTAILFSRSRG